MAACRGKTPGPAHALIDLLNAAASPCKHQPWVGMQGKLSEALEGLLGLEKQQRLAEDITGTKMACTAILTILREAGDWKGLNEHILLLAKRRSQLKQVSPPGPAGSPANSRPWQKTAAPLQPRQTLRSAAPCLCAHKAAACCGGASLMAAACRLVQASVTQWRLCSSPWPLLSIRCALVCWPDRGQYGVSTALLHHLPLQASLINVA